MQDAFGELAMRLPVTVSQDLFGRSCAGGSAVNVATALLSIRHGVVPGSGNLSNPAPAAGLRLLGSARQPKVWVAMVNARGYGGFNSSIILRSHEPA